MDSDPIQLTPPAGVIKSESPRASQGRWIDAQAMRFRNGKPEKIGGWTLASTAPMSGTPRALHAWRDNSSVEYMGGGTYRRLYVLDRTFAPNNITPIEFTGTLSNPFTTTNGSTSVKVTHAGHGQAVGNTVIFTNGTGGLGSTAIGGEYLVQSIIDSNNYTITVPVAAADGNDAFTKILLHMDGTNGSTTFTDTNAGGSAHTWTANGNAQISTAQSKFGGASGLFDGTGDYITTPDHADYTLGSGDFTIDLWFNCTAVGGVSRWLGGQTDAAINFLPTSWLLRRETTNVMVARLGVGASFVEVTGTTQFTNAVNTGFHHLALVRTGNVLKLFIDGVQEGGNVAITGSVNDSAQPMTIGRPGDVASNEWLGNIDEFRLSVGAARWTSNFTPWTVPYLNTGGGTVTYQYELAIGNEAGAYGLGYGVGGYGGSTYGTPRAASTLFVEPRIWSLDHFGQILLASYNTGKLYAWDPSAVNALTTRAAVVSDAPTDFRAMFVTPERFVIGLCDQMKIKWCTQGDYTVWTPTIANTANIRGVTEGTKLIGGRPLGGGISLIWSDSALYLHQYTGSAQTIFDTRLAGRNCGLVSPSAAVTVGSLAFWMGQNNFFMYASSPVPIPNVEDIRKYVFDQVRTDQGYLCAAMFMPRFREVWFFVCVQGQLQPNLYAIVNVDTYAWSVGTLERTAGAYFGHGDTRPYWAMSDGNIYLHEDGHDDAGAAINAFITLAPAGLDAGKTLMEIDGIEPDFSEQSGNVTLTVNAYDRIRTATDTPLETEVETVSPTDTLVDLRIAGRYIGMTVRSNTLGGHFRFGAPTVFAKPQGTRR